MAVKTTCVHFSNYMKGAHEQLRVHNNNNNHRFTAIIQVNLH